mgnify:CR=1 FL=1
MPILLQKNKDNELAFDKQMKQLKLKNGIVLFQIWLHENATLLRIKNNVL